MLNKTDIKQSGNSQNNASLISSAKVVDIRGENSSYNRVWHQGIGYLRQFKLSTKAIILSIAIGTLPVLGIGAIAYLFGSKLITKQIITSQETKAINLSDKVNNFIGEIEDINNDEILISYVDQKVAGWNSEMELKTITAKKEECELLDNGLNSAWQVNILKLLEIL